MKVTYSYLNPTGNITLLVESPVDGAVQPFVALRLMELEPSAEQVGFVKGKTLRMAGGEFCGNASMCAAVLYCIRNGIKESETELIVSGADKPVRTAVKMISGNTYSGRIEMPEAIGTEYVEYDIGTGEKLLPAVKLPGICHIISEAEPDREKAEKVVHSLCEKLGCESLGIMFLDKNNSVLTPLVYVPAAKTLFWESSCASGTTATGIYLAEKEKKPVSLELKQPGGTLKIEASPEGHPILSGKVEMVKTETVSVEI